MQGFSETPNLAAILGAVLESNRRVRLSKPRDLCERTFLFSCEIVRFCLVLSRQPGAHRQIAGQLLRSGTSVGANAEEAKVAHTRREFACRNSIVLKEAREARFWLRVIAASQLTAQDAIEPILAEANELVGIYTATVRKAKKPLENLKVKT